MPGFSICLLDLALVPLGHLQGELIPPPDLTSVKEQHYLFLFAPQFQGVGTEWG